MVIKIEEPKAGYDNPTLKLKNMLPFEYVIVSKEFVEPKTGTSKFGEWHCYGITVHEFLSQDPKTGSQVSSKEEVKASFFPSPKTHPQMLDIPVGVKFKIRSEEVEGNKGTFTKYIVELVDKVEGGVNNNNVAPSQTVEERLKGLKDAGTSKADAVAVLSKEFNIGEAILNAKFEAL